MMSYHIRVRAGAMIVEDQSILLVEFHDENGLHYNLPSGGLESEETVFEAIKREAREEASVEVQVGPLAFVYEYAPFLNTNKYGKTHSLSLIFDCKIKEGSTPSFPPHPDPYQTDVKWIKFSDLHRVTLYPDIKDHIIQYIYVTNQRNIDLIEEHLLAENNHKMTR